MRWIFWAATTAATIYLASRRTAPTRVVWRRLEGAAVQQDFPTYTEAAVFADALRNKGMYVISVAPAPA